MSLTVNWTVFKNFVTTRNLSVQWIDADGNYYLKALDAIFQLDCILNKAANPNETTEFETFYKPGGNKLNQTEASAYARSGKMFSLTTGVFTVNTSETPVLLLSNPAFNTKTIKLYKTYLTAPVSNGTLGGGGGNDNLYNFYLNPTVASNSKPISIVGGRQSNQSMTIVTAYSSPTVINMGSVFHSSSIISDGLITHQFATWIDPGSSMLITVIPSNSKNKVGVSLEFAEE